MKDAFGSDVTMCKGLMINAGEMILYRSLLAIYICRSLVIAESSNVLLYWVHVWSYIINPILRLPIISQPLLLAPLQNSIDL